jgi:PAS domain S-box-containing protein
MTGRDIMTGAVGIDERAALFRAYSAGLRDCVSGAGEAALKIAYELGRKAANDGIGVLEMATIHHQALGEILPAGSAAAEEIVALAGQFFGEAISTFEMTARSFQANARLLGLSHELARQNTESDRAYQQLRTILDATTAIIYLKDARGRYLFVNRRFHHAFGIRREDAIGRMDAEILPASIADVLWGNDRRALHERTPQELEEIFLLDGIPHTYLSIKFPLLDKSDVPYAVCCVATDITERKHADEILRQAKETTEAANRELEAFAYSVSHDLRAPLRHIAGFARILSDQIKARGDAQEQELLGRISAAAQRMSTLIDELLRFSRLLRVELSGSEIDLNRLVDEVISGLEPEIAGRNILWKRETLPSLPADRSLLHQVFVNLISNALKYTRPRNPAVIEIGCREENGEAIVLVRDNGVGFDPRYADKLFGVFQRLHTEEEFEGTGIGLANVRRIVLRHGGRVWADAAPDQGATFYFTLPRSTTVNAPL